MIRLATCRLMLALLMTACLSQFSFGQPGTELGQLQNQLQDLQSRIESMKRENHDDDPFGQRVRSVGRKRATPPPPPEDEALFVRFYDLSDVFSVAPQYPARATDEVFHPHGYLFPASQDSAQASSGGFGGGGGGVFSLPPTMQQQAQNLSLSSALVSVENLIDSIQAAVNPDDWDESGGECTVSILGNTLLISATSNMHDQIADLLNLLREHWGKLKTVSVDAYWIRATASEVKKLIGETEDNRPVGKVDSKLWNSFYTTAVSEKRLAYSASMTGHNGQTLNTVSGKQRNLVTGARPFYTTTSRTEVGEAPDHEGMIESGTWHERTVTGWSPVTTSIQEGVAIQVSPLATRGGNFVVLDLHTRVVELSDVAEAPKLTVSNLVKAQQSVSVDLDRRGDCLPFRLITTLRCPKDAVILAGGMTHASPTAGEDEPNLYVFVKTRIHTIEEDQSDRFE